MRQTIMTILAGSAALLPGLAMADPVELTLWHMEQPPHRVARVAELLEEFNASHPDVQVTQQPQSWGEVYAMAPAAIAAGAGPDMLFAIPDFTPIIKALGVLQPVDALVDKLDAAHGFYDSAVEPYRYDGGIWAVPLYNMSMNLWYRPSVLEAKGVAVPQSWADWSAAAEALNTDGTYGMGLPAAKNLYTDQTVYSVLANGGASEIYNEDGSFAYDGPATVEGYDFYNSLLQYAPADAGAWTWGEAEACFASAACGMILQFSVISTYDTQAGGDAADLGVAAIPSKDGTDHATIAYSNAVMITTQDDAKRAAAETFITWLMEPETYGRFLNMEPGLFLPVTEDGATAASFWSDPTVEKYKSQIETVIANSQNGKLFGFTSGRVHPAIAAISAQNVLSETLQQIAVNGMDPAEAVTAGQARMQALTE